MDSLAESSEYRMRLFPEERLTTVLSWVEQLRRDERLMIIIASSRLDDLLRQTLQRALLHQPGGSDSLFDADRPLGSFSSRILLSYRLGLIDRDYESYLQILRKLRNDAAHAAQHMDLLSAPHIDRIISLQSLASRAPFWTMLNESPVDPQVDPGRSLFRSLVIGVLIAEIAALSTEPVYEGDPFGFDTLAIAPDESKAKEDS